MIAASEIVGIAKNNFFVPWSKKIELQKKHCALHIREPNDLKYQNALFIFALQQGDLSATTILSTFFGNDDDDVCNINKLTAP